MLHGIATAGFCPKGRKAEDGPIDPKYPLTETKTANYRERTRLNILHSDATLIIYSHTMDKGTALTANLCNEMNRTHLMIDLDKTFELRNFKTWLKKENIKTLNIAGPRESHTKGIYEEALSFLFFIFINPGNN